jgi:hypothetical protein
VRSRDLDRAGEAERRAFGAAADAAVVSLADVSSENGKAAVGSAELT